MVPVLSFTIILSPGISVILSFCHATRTLVSVASVTPPVTAETAGDSDEYSYFAKLAEQD